MISDVSLSNPARPDPRPDPLRSPQGAAPAEAARTAAPEPAAPEQPAPIPNPRLRIDTSLNLVVVEIRDAEGATRTIPSAREMQAYRTGQAEPPGGAPKLDVTR